MKGGTGKTTVACALSVAAQRTGLTAALIDIDPRASAATWADRREATSPAIISAQAPRLAPVLEAARNAGAEIAIIDWQWRLGNLRHRKVGRKKNQT